MFVEALQARLKVLDDEILRLTMLASEAPDKRQQEHYWDLARDLQREARELRSEIKKVSECKVQNQARSHPSLAL
ncbi:MAG TPA: hypothetical protein VN901_18340 [Candidatus Acidoferrales bacterium]|nr:hypothetical protein [Candidatus Acidoferrales bacterium]